MKLFHILQETTASLKENVELYYHDPYDDENVEEQAYNLARQNGIRILSDKELLAYFQDGDRVIAAVFVGHTNEEYDLDIVVDEGYRRRGFAGRLIQVAINDYEELKDAYGDNFELKAYVVNPMAIRLFQKNNFEIDEQVAGRTVMKYVG